ncbi:MAG: hypothetical protein LUB59_08035, partial [Candidatus Gastranaerophilales bacterium]|nr:hypothetical protein [Candidatus Gastranaerophilales bacterium]
MKKLIPVFISVVIININMLSAGAAENILRCVNVKTTPNAYTVELTSTTPAYMTKNIISSNRIIINLKNIEISDKLSTKFDGNAVIDNVMVEPCGANNVNIMIQGDNIAHSSVEFKSLNTMEQVEDSVASSFSSLANIMTGSGASNRTVQFLTLLIFGIILISEVKFIKSKYDELNAERQFMLKDIENTHDFKEYTPGYGYAGLKKPYTTPVWGYSGNNLSGLRKNYLQKLRTPETITLNMLLNSNNQENKILDRIVNNKPVFGTLSSINIEDKMAPKDKSAISNPLTAGKLKQNIKYLQSLSEIYRDK